MTRIVLPSLLQAVFFALKGSVVIWTRWLIKDVGVRQAYHTSVNTVAAEMLRDVDGGRLLHIDGANRAVHMRNTFLSQMRDRTSPCGHLIACYLKSAGGTVEYYLNGNARERYGVNYDEITQDAQRNQVVIDTVKSANARETGLLKGKYSGAGG